MDGVEALRRAVNASHQWYQGTVADVTPEQANYRPPGTAHTIAETAAHILHGEDGVVNGMLRGRAPLWERGGYGERLGIPYLMSHDAVPAGQFQCDVQALQEYAQALYAETDEYFDSLTDADLDQESEVEMLGTMTVADKLAMFFIGNVFAHTGEISAIKGVQGAKGYPF